MRQIQVIELHGRPVGLALGDKTIIADHHITDDDQPIVAGMALYALDIQAGARAARIPTPSATRGTHSRSAPRAGHAPAAARTPPHVRDRTRSASLTPSDDAKAQQGRPDLAARGAQACASARSIVWPMSANTPARRSRSALPERRRAPDARRALAHRALRPMHDPNTSTGLVELRIYGGDSVTLNA